MQHFLCRLIGPRPTFPHDMSADEQRLMGEHMGYWKGLLQRAQAVVFGPVADPKGFWGLGILQVGSEAEACAIVDNDPVSRASAGFSYRDLCHAEHRASGRTGNGLTRGRDEPRRE